MLSKIISQLFRKRGHLLPTRMIIFKKFMKNLFHPERLKLMCLSVCLEHGIIKKDRKRHKNKRRVKRKYITAFLQKIKKNRNKQKGPDKDYPTFLEREKTII
jgi:hypothetical protein